METSASESGDWPPPSPAVAELIRTVAADALATSGEIFDVVDTAVLEAAPERLQAEPVLVEALRSANHANMTRWLSANAAAPGARVKADVGQVVIELARDIVRRGFDDASLNSYRVGQNAALRFLMGQVFEVSDDIDEIREVLEVASRSIFAFVDDTLAAIDEQIGLEREALARGTHAERLVTVNLVLEGAPISEKQASSRLGYELGAEQLAAIVWSGSEAAAAGLERGAELIAKAVGAPRPFTVVASSRSLWVWVSPPPVGAGDPGEADTPALASSSDLDLADLDPDVSVAVGARGGGIAGFRRSHLTALASQRLMGRARHPVRVAVYPEVELVALASEDEERAVGFVRRTLGDLADADQVIKDTLLAYLRADLNASAAAADLYAHRNTVNNRLDRARDLLPAPANGRTPELGLALELDRWLGLSGGA